MLKKILPVTLVIANVLVNGCGDTDGRLARVATDAAERQARQSEQMAKSHTELTQGARHLVESAGRSQESLVTVQKGLEQQQAEIGRQRDVLESERKALASQRHTEPIMAAAISEVGLLIACLLPLVLCWLVLCRSSVAESDPVITQILIEEVAGNLPPSLPGPSPKSADPRLEFPRQSEQ